MKRIGVFLMVILLLVPTGVQAEWSMFGKDATHSGIAEITERTIQKRTPTVSWDRGSSSEEVYSWGTSIGNFSANIIGDTYDRNVLHIAYVRAEDNGDWLRGYLVIRDGGNPGKVMWEYDLGNIRDQSNQSLETEFNNFEAAYGTPAIADFDNNGLMDVAVATPNGRVYFFEPEIVYNSQNEGYGSEHNGDSWSYDSDITIIRSNPAITSFQSDGGNDLVISGIDIESNEIKVIAIDGNNGNELWKFEEAGSEISSPTVLEDGSNRKVFVSVYENTNLEIYSIQGGSKLSGWDPKTIGTIVSPSDSNQHPMLPSIVIADITDDSGKEILVPQPPATANGDSQLWLFKDNGIAATGWSSAYELTGGGDMDATPAVGNLDSDSDLEIVAVTWEDPGSASDNEITHVWAIGNDATLEWETEYDTDSSGGWDNDEHAISSPILAVIYDEDGKDNLDVFTCTTPRCYALDGTDGLDGGGSKDYLWYVTLEGRDNDNRIFTSPAASDVDGDGLLDFIIDGSVYSADLADLTLKSSDIVITDGSNITSEIEESQDVVFYPITIRNDGNHDASNIAIEVRLDSLSGTLLHSETIDTLNSNSITNLQKFNWTAEGQGNHQIWVMCIVDEEANEEVRYDNNNASKSILVRPQYGLDLTISDSSESVDITQTASFDVDIINMGLRTDNYTLSVTVMSPDWTISHPLQVSNLSSNISTIFSVNFIPGIKVTSAVHQFTITAVSQGNISRSDSVYVNIEVSQYYNIKLEMPLSNQRVFPGTTLYYPVKITNQGNGDDTFDLYTSSDWGAQIRIDNSPAGSITLAAFRTIEAELKIVVPEEVSVDDYKEIIFTANSRGDDSISQSLVSNTSIGIMMAEKAVVNILPGGNASFLIEFLNPEEDTAVFSVSILSGAPDWENSISPDNVSLSHDEIGYTWINFTAPNTATPGNSYMMEFALSNNQTLDKLNVVLEVGAIRGARLWSDSDADLAYTNPDSTVYFDVRVVNYEPTSLDNISLDYQSTLMPGWSVVYNNESTWSRTLPAHGSTFVSIGVTAPSNAEAVETVWLRIIATVSGFDDTFFDANITVNQDFGVSISSESVTTLLGNVTQLVTISITNTGNGPDLFEVSYSGIWTENGTEILTFDGFETKDFTLTVNSALSAPGSQSNIFLQVNSTKSEIAGDPKIDSTVLSFIVTGMKPVGSQSIQLSQGESSSFDLVILSLIDSESSTTRVITEVNGDVYWWVNFDDTEEFEDKQTLIVPVGQPDIFSFTVTAPVDAESGNYEFILKITDYNEPSHVSTLVYNLYVRQNFNISVISISEPLSTNPGSTADWNIRYTNNGNGDDQITIITVGVPENWSYSFTETVVVIQPYNPKDIGFSINVPENQLPGDYNFLISAQSLGITVNLSINLTINSVYQLSASSTSLTEVTALSGETVYYQFEVTNGGNTADTILVSSTGSMISSSSTDFQWTSRIIEPGVTESNYLKATVPQNNDGPWNAIVSIRSTFDESMVVNLQYSLNANLIPDAGIENLALSPSNPLPGEKVNARFTVTSTNAPIDSVSYSIYIDGSIAGGGQVVGIEDGGNKVVTFTFMAEEGNHDFKVVLNPNSELEETDMSNNEIQMSFKVEGSSNSNLPIYIGVFAVILVGGAVLYSYSKRENKLITKTKVAPIIQESSVNFPLILNCTQCGSRVRVARPGSFRCPSCKVVSLVDSNGKIGSTEQEKEVVEKQLPPKSVITSSKIEKPISSTTRRRRMEEFLLDDTEEEKSKETEVELSASEKLRLLKEEENSALDNSEEVQEPVTEDSKIEAAEPEKVQEKPKKKRKGPPKGGSFGPTVGGF